MPECGRLLGPILGQIVGVYTDKSGATKPARRARGEAGGIPASPQSTESWIELPLPPPIRTGSIKENGL